jgi:hypothetical protein
MGQQDFFAEEKQLRKIYGLNGFLARLGRLVDFEAFRSESSVLRRETPKGKGRTGRVGSAEIGLLKA